MLAADNCETNNMQITMKASGKTPALLRTSTKGSFHLHLRESLNRFSIPGAL